MATPMLADRSPHHHRRGLVTPPHRLASARPKHNRHKILQGWGRIVALSRFHLLYASLLPFSLHIPAQRLTYTLSSSLVFPSLLQTATATRHQTSTIAIHANTGPANARPDDTA